MPFPFENKTVQSNILQFAQDIGWTYVFCYDTERQRAYHNGDDIQYRMRTSSSLIRVGRSIINMSGIESISNYSGESL